METMKATHTPGPYHIGAITGNRIVGDETVKAEKYQLMNSNATIATVYRAKDCPLLKAAPDMYKALKKISDAKSFGRCQWCDWTNGIHQTDCVAELARSALAQAEGKE